MSDHEPKIRQLQQIPVFALRQAVTDLVDQPNMQGVVLDRMRSILGLKPRQLKRTIQRLSRDQLSRLINACPEISESQIQELFEEYRYGANPSFYIFYFVPRQVKPLATDKFRSRVESALKSYNEILEEGLPRLRRIELNDLSVLPDRIEIIEGTYRFQARLDYIDEEQNAVSTYQTLYSFFWLNTSLGYSIIQGRNPEVLQGLISAIQSGAGISLIPLPILKEIKNTLPFLKRDAFRSGRLYDPNPDSKRFRWLTIADEDPYEKGYEAVEMDYPEVRSARYREMVGATKETSLTIRCDQGAFSLAGKLRASQFRAWCLDRLEKVIEVWFGFLANLPAYIETQDLPGAPEMKRFSENQREVVIKLITALLTLKASPAPGRHPTGVGALEMAAVLGDFVRVRVPYENAEAGWEEEALLACPNCQSTLFYLVLKEERWILRCAKERINPTEYALPLQIQTDQDELITVNETELARRLEILPGKDLMAAMAAAINQRLVGLPFFPPSESFIVRGSNLIYYPEPPTRIKDTKTLIFVHQEVGTLQSGGSLTGSQDRVR